MKVGRFGLFSRFDLDSWFLSKSLTPTPERPRIYISGNALGSEPNCVLVIKRKEGSNDCMASSTFVCDTLRNSSPVICVELPVKLDLRTLLYPVTTTSSNVFTSSTIVISSIFLRVASTWSVCFFIPIKETSKVTLSFFTSSVNSPSMFVEVPVRVPFTIILAPGIGSLFESTTIPRIRFSRFSACILRITTMPSFTT